MDDGYLGIHFHFFGRTKPKQGEVPFAPLKVCSCCTIHNITGQNFMPHGKKYDRI